MALFYCIKCNKHYTIEKNGVYVCSCGHRMNITSIVDPKKTIIRGVTTKFFCNNNPLWKEKITSYIG